MILDNTYFQGELYLPNLRISSTTTGVAEMLQTVGENGLDWYIEKYEKEALILVLGRKLYDSFMDGLNEDPIDPMWVNLKDSLFETKGSFSYSPIANYVYFFISRRGQTQTSVQGEIRGEMSYAYPVSDSDKLVKVWNDMCYQIHDFKCRFLFENWDVYKDYTDSKRCYDYCYFQTINKFNI